MASRSARRGAHLMRPPKPHPTDAAGVEHAAHPSARLIRTVGLLTPYTGGNLGDRAIQAAVIHHIRKRYPDVRLYGLTLAPEVTEALHGIPCYPLTALSLSYYAVSSPARDVPPSSAQDNQSSPLQIAKTYLRKSPAMYSLLKKAVDLLQAPYRLLIAVRNELAHLPSMYKTCKRTDLLIVSGGGQLDDYWGGPWGHPYVLFKWALIAKVTGTKFVFLSVGTCALDSRLSGLFTRWALKLAAYRSYRDETSRAQLATMRFTRTDPVFPDLAFSYPWKPDAHAKPATGRIVIGISPIAYLSPHYWPRRDDEIYDRYIAQLAAFVAGLLRKQYSVVFFITATPDRHGVDDILETLRKDATLADFLKHILQPKMVTLDELLVQLSQTDCIVASRLHGIVLSHLAGRPVLAISYDRKVDTYMAHIGQTEYCLDIHNLELDSLRRDFASLMSNADTVQSQLRARIEIYENALQTQYNRILQ
jgi:polysaccharide pyruvyl transferase WcaK-like protein